MGSYILKGLVAFGKFFIKSKKLIPGSIAGIFVLIQFFIDLFKFGVSFAFKNLATSLLAAEYQINKAVTLAVQNSDSYNLASFFSIVSSFFIIYYFVKWIGKFLIGVTGSQARAMAYFIAVIILGVIELSTVRIVDGVWGFVPIKDGIWFLLMNLNVVFQNIHWFS